MFCVGTLSAMRRALLIFIMVLLPFQWVWAAAASTYSHESTVSTPEFGQHAHEHVAEQVSAGANADQGLLGADHPDCGVCHFWAAMACATATLQPVSMWAYERIGTATPAFNSHVPAGPERPDRSATP